LGNNISDLAFGLCGITAGNACGELCSQVLPEDLARWTLWNGIREEHFADPLVENNL
jgi:hypothetical protein